MFFCYRSKGICLFLNKQKIKDIFGLSVDLIRKKCNLHQILVL
ncbi:hypothetical protein HMPREF9442_02197 [Paraprevotella xylaniphila YIT 11841]|uniref:Uncharacterized protein n=1 Tax=Paraprevotella xylaniphila YIT 11841 TaxID=762982 RepID=F3QVH1_9BACT|nr:hypothetical protein HMPREF9442_02197 [Paraprevotella xylaniphila YIT 11841]